ncbi:hypothetical protein D3877_23600 [Azospirillum cavernae]|uniref:Uncharacterized protein n=1 Tax=Azospirillum cavernae TaxID=2320860 RepID=A0A418VPC6_9PROT|nr:hypothetical protein [Azospirillum cavernae]RJF78117.1 hypothetical protein D3877_23600 [Azospirillum cavernae]
MLDTLAIATDLKISGFHEDQEVGMARTLNKQSGQGCSVLRMSRLTVGAASSNGLFCSENDFTKEGAV